MQQLLERLRTLVTSDESVSAPSEEDGVHLAAAALLLQMASADFEQDSAELVLVTELLQRLLPRASRTEIEELLDRAAREAAESVSLFDFTEVVHRQWSLDQKVSLIEDLWRVAYADGHLDPKEEFLVRKVNGLLHVPHHDFIAAKQRAREGAA